MKNPFRHVIKRPAIDETTLATLRHENSQLRKERDDYAQQLSEVLTLLENSQSAKALTTISVRQLDALGLGLLLGCEKVRQEESGAIIVSDLEFYHELSGAPIEICIPPGMHFGQLSQIVDTVVPQAYQDLSGLLTTYGELAVKGFLSCVWEEIGDTKQGVQVRRLTLAPPEQRSFAYICGDDIFPLTLDADRYVELAEKHLKKEMTLHERDEACTYFENVMQAVCASWHDEFAGVTFAEPVSDEI